MGEAGSNRLYAVYSWTAYTARREKSLPAVARKEARSPTPTKGEAGCVSERSEERQPTQRINPDVMDFLILGIGTQPSFFR
jgi:hypothetical protein